MSVNAQLAQGTKFYIGTTTGAAKTITAATIGNPTILTSTSHGLSNGDIVAIASIVGSLGTDATLGLNGKSVVVKNKTTSTFAVDLDSTGLVYTSGGTATPQTYTQIKEVKSFKPGGASASKIDVTDLDSTAKENRTGLPDNGTFSVDIHPLPSDPGQDAVLASFNANTVKTYKLQVLGGNSFTFNASVTKFPTIPDGAVDGVLTGSVELAVSGAVTKA